MEEQNKEVTTRETEKRLVAQLAKQTLLASIIEQTEGLTKRKLSERNKKNEAELITLLSGDQISISKIKALISDSLNTYSPIYPTEFYTEIYRLNGWKIPEEKFYKKPHKVANWTNDLIYSRHSKEILPALQQVNPYIAPGVRANKHYCWLTTEGKFKTEGFISDMVKMMNKYNSWIEFERKYKEEYIFKNQRKLWAL